MAKGQKTGGRRKGVRNKATAEIRAALQLHGDELVGALLALTKSADERVRLGVVIQTRSESCRFCGGFCQVMFSLRTFPSR